MHCDHYVFASLARGIRNPDEVKLRTHGRLLIASLFFLFSTSATPVIMHTTSEWMLIGLLLV